jgi:hypothetical protein
MSAPADRPTTAPAPPKPGWTQDLKIDPPSTDGPQIGDVVVCWHGEVEPPMPIPGVVTNVGHNGRVNVNTFPKDWSSMVPQDGCIPHDDASARGHWLNIMRYKPAPNALAVRVLTERMKAMEAKLLELGGAINDLRVSLKPKS